MSVLIHLIRWQLGVAPSEVWTTDAERACLARHAAGRRRLVEVGVWHGGTTRHLRAAMSSEATLYAVDPFPWKAWSPVVGAGGVICLHDSRPWPQDQPVQSSVEYARTVVRNDARFAPVDEVDSLTVLRRLPG